MEQKARHKKVVIITGGSGLIGDSLTRELQSAYQVIVLDKKRPVTKNSRVIFHHLDLSSKKSLRQVLSHIRQERGEKIYSVVHLAGHYDFSGKEDPRYDSVNVAGTENLLVTLKELFEVGQFIFASSMLVYAPSPVGEKIIENSPLDPDPWPYPRSKMMGEDIVKRLHGHIPTVTLRIAAVYNDFGYAPSITQQILRIYELHPTSFLFPGDWNHVQSCIHCEDLVEAIAHTIHQRDTLPQELTLSVAEDDTPSYLEIQKETARLSFGKKLPLFKIPKALAWSGAYLLNSFPLGRESFIQPWMMKYADANYDLDNTRIKEVLNWRPQKDLWSTLPRIIRNLKIRPHQWYRINKVPPPLLSPLLKAQFLRKVGGHL